MANRTVATRKTGQAHSTVIAEGVDAAVLSDIVRSTAGAANLWADPSTTAITVGSAGTPVTIADELRGPNDGTGLVVGHAPSAASTGSALQIVSLTTTQKDNLVAANGMVVLDTTLNQLQARVSGVWADLGDTGASPPHLDKFTANDAILPSANRAAIKSRNGHPVTAYDDTTAESVSYSSSMSRDYSAGNVIVDIDWVAETAITGAVVWGVEFERTTPGGADIDVDSFAAQQTGTSTTNATSGLTTRTTITLTQAQADSIAAGDGYRLRVQRVAAGVPDNMMNDAQVKHVTVRQ